MFARAFLLLALVLLSSCIRQAEGRDADLPGVGARAQLIDWGTAVPVPPPSRDVILAATAPGSAAAPFAFAEGQQAGFGNALDCLTAAVYYEARSESPDGQRAVAQVVLNRARHPAYPNNVCGVVFQGSQRRTGCQFSFTCDGSMRRGSRNAAAWEQARGVAQTALSGDVFAPVGLATHYHTTAIRAWWAPSLTRAITIGAHIFYRWPGRWGDPTAFTRPVTAGGSFDPAPPPVVIAAANPARETVMGVTIHRGGGSVRRPTAVPVARAPSRTRQAAHGVRIHSGAPSAPREEQVASGSAPASEAITR